MWKTIGCFLFYFTINGVFGQQFTKGLILDPAEYERTPLRAPLLERDYTTLPPQYSLKAFCPRPSSQGSYGTCVGWSIAYAARTVMEAIQTGRKSMELNANEAFSPGFIYYHVKSQSDLSCSQGLITRYALNFVTKYGVPKRRDFSESCVSEVPTEINRKALPYRITGYTRLFETSSAINYRLQAVKKALMESHPVVVGMNCPDSFHDASGVWQPKESPAYNHGGHAMCVIGYDDNQYGGAFEIQNSWGANWGNNGFIWIRYRDFYAFVNEAYELYISPSDNIDPSHAPILGGKLTFQLATGENLNAQKVNSEVNFAHYRLANSIFSGSRYRIYINSQQAAYVYLLGGDNSGGLSRLFPHNGKISPFLAYKKSAIAIPNEQFYIQADATLNKEYLWLIYSKKELDLASLLQKVELADGNFPEKAKQAFFGVSTKQNTTFNPGELVFQQTNSDNTSMVSMVLEIVKK